MRIVLLALLLGCASWAQRPDTFVHEVNTAAKPSSVRVFSRNAPIPAMVTKGPRRMANWPPANPRILAATCMKDEGPFILEWVAWHRAMGLTDLVVFTNDCTDGTDDLLDRLDEMGELKHLPNPASTLKNPHFQPVALQYVKSFPVFRGWRCLTDLPPDVNQEFLPRSFRGALPSPPG